MIGLVYCSILVTCGLLYCYVCVFVCFDCFGGFVVLFSLLDWLFMFGGGFLGFVMVRFCAVCVGVCCICWLVSFVVLCCVVAV